MTKREMMHLGMILWLCCELPVSASSGHCQIETSDRDHAVLTVRLSAECSKQDRERHAVQAATLLAAIKQGKAIDVSGAVVQGDVRLDDLPLGSLPKALEQRLPEAGGDVRIIPAAVSIMNSEIHGAIRHRSAQGVLIVNGPLMLTKSVFQQAVDLSRTVFVQPVSLSGAVFMKESYFVQARFLGDLSAEKTAFGPHTRFHRTHFEGAATFRQAGFSGLAEFLEVVFARDADFSGTYFKLGTGFSGSHFRGLADFSEALFEREAFFTFTRFDGDTFFRRATFRSTADFDDAEFRMRDDFSKVLFEGDSRFARVKRPANGPPMLGIENSKVQYLITLSLLVFSVLLIAYLIRSR